MRSFFILNYVFYNLNNQRIVKLKKCFKNKAPQAPLLNVRSTYCVKNKQIL